VRACSGRYLLFLNPDARLEEVALERMLQALVSAPDVGMVGGFLCNPDGTEQAGGRRVLPTPRRAFVRAFGLASLARLSPRLFSDFLLHGDPLPDRPVAVEAISGACMMVKRQAMEEVGLWDEGYFLHCEDVDWCMRFSQAGWKTLFVPHARVTHYKGTCSRTRPIFVEWHKHKGMVRFYRKFFRDQYPGLLMTLVTTAVWLRFGLVCGSHAVRPRWWRLAVRPVLLRLKTG
jgi:GT2 family glycosyltransferase